MGDWKLLGRLGSGGMGVVYYGVDFKKSSKNEVALKIIREHILEEPSARSRLEREIDSLHAVDSPYVAKIVDSNIDSSPAWIATQRVNGPSLSKWVEDNGPVSYLQWLNLAYGMLHAINAIHNAGIIHRDIKPSNVLLEQQGEILVPKLIDFGIAVDQSATSITSTGVVVGTPAWLAPEQFMGGELTNSVDMFAIGATLLFAATGRNPWGVQDTTPLGVVIGTMTANNPNLDGISKEQKQLLAPLLQKKVEKRLSAYDAIRLVEELSTAAKIDLLKLAVKSNYANTTLSTKSTRAVTSTSSKKIIIGSSLAITLLTAGFLIFTSTPVSAKISIELTSKYLNGVCVGTSGLQGIENSQVFVKSTNDPQPIFVGKLDEGIYSPGNTCLYSLPVNSYDPDASRYELQINFPWDTFRENFRFEDTDSKNPIYTIKLKLD